MVKVTEWVFGAADRWHESKLFVENLTDTSHEALHLLAGVAIWLAFAMVSRRSLDTWLPLAATLVVATLNEAVDLTVEIWPSRERQIGESVQDIVLTMSVPLLLFLASRARPMLLGRNRRSRR